MTRSAAARPVRVVTTRDELSDVLAVELARRATWEPDRGSGIDDWDETSTPRPGPPPVRSWPEAVSGHGQVVLVPTMGALHAGHATLVRRARAMTRGPVVVSVFVNPLQFAAGEDLDRYPRSLEADLEVCTSAGADVVFHPGVAEVYPDGEPQVSVEPGQLGSVLEGEVRPGHFRGVLTVVAKLFGIVRPDVAVFGRKDYQQLVLVRRMVEDLCLGVEVVGVETEREADGLALSSRNRYLAPADRERAPVLHDALLAAAGAAGDGPEAARAAGLAVLDRHPDLVVDYLEVTDRDLGAAPAEGLGRVLGAVRVGGVRLIDNLPLTLGAGLRRVDPALPR